MNIEGVEFCFMEASSHGIDQKRTEGLQFAGAIFTNLSHDHLDYHNSFAEYRDTKKRLFDELPKNAFALSNIDDKNGLVMLQNTRAKKYTYALKSYADYRAQILENQFSGQLLKIDSNTKSTVSAIRKAQHEIDLIREYRTRLITDVVSGKLDVRHFSPEIEAEPTEPIGMDEDIDDEEPEFDDEATDAND